MIASIGMKRPTDPIPEVMSVLRALYIQVPGLRGTLSDLATQRHIHDLLLPLLAAGGAQTDAQSVAQLLSHGYFVTRTAPAVSSRPESSATRRIGLTDNFGVSSQRGRLLLAYAADGGTNGYTAEEAAVAAHISPRSCYWKRVSELLLMGLVETAEGPHGGTMRRPGTAGSLQDVYVVSVAGESKAASLED